MQHRHNVLSSERFGNVVFCSRETTFEAINHTVATSKHHDSCIAELRFCSQATGKLITSHFGKINVKYQQVRYASHALFGDCTQGFNSICKTDRFEAFAFQAGFYDLGDGE